MALLEQPDATLHEVLRIITDKDFRRSIAKSLGNETVRAFLLHEFDQFSFGYRADSFQRVASWSFSTDKGDAMRKSLTALAAATTLTVAAVATPTTADARWGWWGPALGGFAAGAIIGSALARPYYAYPYYGYRYYGYAYPAYYGYYAQRPYYGYYARRYYAGWRY